MSDRTPLISAIDATPNCDVARLVYADFCDEQDSDADRATAEYIRLSCRMRPKSRPRNAEVAWLASNWHRVVPALAAAGFALDGQDGRMLYLSVERYKPPEMPPPDTHILLLRRGCRLMFSRGFVSVAISDMRSLSALRFVAADQPLAVLEITNSVCRDGNAGYFSREAFLLADVANDIFDRLEGCVFYDSNSPDPPGSALFRQRKSSNANCAVARLALSVAIHRWSAAATPELGGG